jgi:hypothetical protein
MSATDWARGILAAVLCSSLLACSPSQPKGSPERTWTEDVLLDNGETITVKRFVSFNESDAWSGGAYNAVETKSTIQFTGALANLPPWDQPLIAMVMYRDKATKELVIVAHSSSCQVWGKRGKPKPPYWEFRLNRNGCLETPLSQGSIGRLANLFSSYQPELKTQHITVAERQRLESNPLIVDEYKQVVGSVEPHYCNM